MFAVAVVALFLPSFFSRLRKNKSIKVKKNTRTNLTLSSLSIRTDSVELAPSKVSASNEAINKSPGPNQPLHASSFTTTCPSSDSLSYIFSPVREKFHPNEN